MLWNAAVPHRPAVVVLCESVHDVQGSVRAARTHRLPLSVRGDDHDWAGRSHREAGLVIDLTRMRQVTVTGRVTTGRVTTGRVATSLPVLTAAGPNGLTGSIGSVGITVLTLGGGYGTLAEIAGLAANNLLGVDLFVDGRVGHPDATPKPDLFWALRGAGGKPNPSNLAHGWDAGFLVGEGLVMSALVKVGWQDAIAAVKKTVPASPRGLEGARG